MMNNEYELEHPVENDGVKITDIQLRMITGLDLETWEKSNLKPMAQANKMLADITGLHRDVIRKLSAPDLMNLNEKLIRLMGKDPADIER
jgi:hypothetical protein